MKRAEADEFALKKASGAEDFSRTFVRFFKFQESPRVLAMMSPLTSFFYSCSNENLLFTSYSLLIELLSNIN